MQRFEDTYFPSFQVYPKPNSDSQEQGDLATTKTKTIQPQ